MISQHACLRSTTAAILALTLSVVSVAGCTSKQDALLEKARQQANATGQPQPVVTTDKNGDTITTVVQPLQPGQKTQAMTTTITPAQAPVPTQQGTPAGYPSAQPDQSQPSNQANNQAPPPPQGYQGQPNQPNQAYQGQPNQQYPGQPGQPNDAKPYAGQASQQQPYPGQPSQGQPYPAQPNPPQYAQQEQPQPPAPAPIRIPAGTSLVIRINQHISVKSSRPGDRFSGEIEEPIVGPGRFLLIPRGTPVEGVVEASHRRGHFKGRSILELRLTSLSLRGVRYPIDTDDLTRTKKGKGKRSAAFIGGGAGAGMLIGGIASGGVGLLVGGLAGAGGGALAGGLTGNRDIEIPAESIVRFHLADPLVLQPA
jgi:hypothetical protein